LIPHGVDNLHFLRTDSSGFISRFGLAGSEIILYLGRVNLTKGIHILLDAFAKVVSLNPNSRLVIAGPASSQMEVDYGKSLVEKTKRLGIEDKVIFTGRLTEEEKLAALESCDVFVLPSLYEPYGLVLLEAAAHGKPLISTRTDGPLDVVEEDLNGYLVPPGDSSTLADRIVTVLSDSTKARRLGSNGRARAAGRTWELVAKSVEHAYAVS
jgi:1,4-alpha-glucan branching enzyme